MKSLKLALAAALAVAFSAGAVAQAGRDRTGTTKDQTQTRSEQQRDVTRDRNGQSARDQTPYRSDQSRDQVKERFDVGRDTDAQRTGRLRELEQLGSARVIFFRLGPADMRVSKLIGLDVRNLQNENVGEIEDLILDNGKNVRAVIVGVGGFLGMGERYVAFDPGSIVINRGDDGDIEAVLNTSREDLREAPEFRFDARRRKVGQIE